MGKADELRFWREAGFRNSMGAHAHEWLHRRALDRKGKSPIEFIRAGEFDRVIEILATFHAGAFI